MNPFDRARRSASKILLSWGCLAVAVVLVSRPCTCGQRLIETRDWNLQQLVDHLQARGLTLRVVPTHKSGSWSNSIYLTTESDLTWDCLQQKSRNIEKIDQWRGVVLVEQLIKNPGPQWDVGEWGSHGLQIDRFVLFGDADLLKLIGQAVVIDEPTCKLAQWLSSH